MKLSKAALYVKDQNNLDGKKLGIGGFEPGASFSE